MELRFKKWLEAGEVWGVEAPVQDPVKLGVTPNAGAFPRYEVEPDKQPRMKKKMRKDQSSSSSSSLKS